MCLNNITNIQYSLSYFVLNCVNILLICCCIHKNSFNPHIKSVKIAKLSKKQAKNQYKCTVKKAYKCKKGTAKQQCLLNIEETDYLITALLGGGLCGSGVGLVLLSGASTGGTDMLAVLLHKYLKNYSVIQIMQYLDALIVAAGAAVFGIYVSLYAIIAIYITTVISDNILEGTKHGVAAFVITDNYEIIADIIKRDMNRGVTLIKGQGMYSYKPKNMLLCVVSRKEISQLKQICVEKDRECFILISDVREVMGEGFVQNIQ